MSQASVIITPVALHSIRDQYPGRLQQSQAEQDSTMPLERGWGHVVFRITAHIQEFWCRTEGSLLLGDIRVRRMPEQLDQGTHNVHPISNLWLPHSHSTPTQAQIKCKNQLMEMYTKIHLPSYWPGAGVGYKSWSGDREWQRTKNNRPNRLGGAGKRNSSLRDLRIMYKFW